MAATHRTRALLVRLEPFWQQPARARQLRRPLVPETPTSHWIRQLLAVKHWTAQR
jgi:hypothetical protein